MLLLKIIGEKVERKALLNLIPEKNDIRLGSEREVRPKVIEKLGA